jgi:hypothetical protein
MDRVANDAIGIILSYLTLNERLDGMARVSRAWRVFTRASFVAWMRRLSLEARVPGYYDKKLAGPVRFVQQHQYSSEIKHDDACHFVADSEKHELAAPKHMNIEIKISGQLKEHVERIDWKDQDTHTHNRIQIVRKMKGQVSEATIVSFTLTIKDLVWMAPVARRNRLSLLCMLVHTDAAVDLRASLHGIMRYGASHGSRVRNLCPLVDTLGKPFTCGISTAELVLQVRAVLTLTVQCHQLFDSNHRYWWLERGCLLELLASKTESGLAKAVAFCTGFAQTQDRYLRMRLRLRV